MKTKKNIVLLHGWGAETKKLEPLKKSLNKLGWKAFLPKLAGFENPAPKNIWGIKEYSEQVYVEAKKYFGKDRFFVFGHSFGGGIAIKLSANNSSKISGIILCATRGISRGNLLKRILFSLVAKIGKVFLVVPPLANTFKKLLYKAAREHDYEKTDGIMREVFKKVISEDLKPLIKKSKERTLLLWGENDRITPIGDAFFIKDALPKATLITYDGIGHRLPYEKPEELAREINLWYQKLY